MAHFSGDNAARRNDLIRLLAAAGLLGMGCVFVWKTIGFASRALWAVNSPYELDYGEGIVWQQLEMIFDGRGYAPFKSFPAIVFHYPPLYHAATWLAATLSGANYLAAGRALSVLCTLAAAILIGMIAGYLVTGSSRKTQWICGGTAALASLSAYPVAVWSPLMRVDMLAVALSLGGICLAILAFKRPGLIYAAAISFVCSVFTKQTMVAAPAAAFLVMLFFTPRLAFRGICASVVIGLIVLLGLSAISRGEFAHHIFGYNINRFSVLRLGGVAHIVHQHAVFLLAALIGMAWCLDRIRRAPKPSRSDGPVSGEVNVPIAANWIAIVYAVATTFSLVLVGKSGSTVNYYVEWFFAVSVFVGVSVAPAVNALSERTGLAKLPRALRTPLILLPMVVSAGVFLAPPVAENAKFSDPAYAVEFQTLMKKIRNAKRPVISDNMVVLKEAGKEVVLEPAIVAELTATKVYDERPLLRLIQNREFAFFVTAGGRGDPLFDPRYSPAVVAAIYRYYPRVEKVAGLNVRSPGDPAGRKIDLP